MNDPSRTQIRLDLDRLVREYVDNLTIQLRGFKAAESFEFLEAWVPHDDPTESVLELADLARDAGLSRLVVDISSETAARLDMGHIEEVAGSVSRRRTPEGIELEFVLDTAPRAARPVRATAGTRIPEVAESESSGQPASPELVPQPVDAAAGELAIHPCYRAELLHVLEDLRHQGRPQPVEGLQPFSARDGHWELAALIHPKTRVVKHAGFVGTGARVEVGLLEVLCRVMEERPIQECADHAAIGVEYDLRDKRLPPPVVGLLTPDNADPAFQLPQRIVRQLLAEFRSRTGYADTNNFFDRPASPRWTRLSDEDRQCAIRQALNREDAAGQVKFIRMDGVKRVVVQFTTELTSHQKQDLLRRLEITLRETVEPTLQLTAMVRADSNILRAPDKKK